MSSEEEESVGRAPTPSARKSIHSHAFCIFANSVNMGRYGLEARCDGRHDNYSSLQDQGTDEVDNVMSKFARKTSPLPARQGQKKQKKRERRNSLSLSSQQYTDDDDSEAESSELAKSLPANLPSYCSEDFAHQSLPSDFYKIHDSTTVSPSQSRNTNTDFNFDNTLDALGQKQREYNQETKKEPSSHRQILLPLIGVLILATGVYFKDVLERTEGDNNKTYYDEIKFTKDLIDLGEKYRINDNSILEVQTGISTILERNDTGSFIFVYNAEPKNDGHLKFSNFMKDIASTVAQYLRNNTKLIQPTTVHSTQLDMQTHGELMNKYRNEVSKSGVLLVKDVENIPSYLAMAFHYFCDEYNPLVAKSAIFFTLNMANCSNDSGQKFTHLEVEKCLAHRWKSVPKDNITPLLARVVNVVIDVTHLS